LDIIFVTNKKSEGWEKRLDDLDKSIASTDNIIFTGLDASASVNRNFGLDKVVTKEFIMLDDDIEGFHPTWTDRFAQHMWYNEKIVCMTARLLNPDGSWGPMMGNNNDYTSRHARAGKSGYNGYTRLPTACLILKKNHLRYDEGYIGSGYEDTDMMNQLNILYPDGEFHINNDVKLTHLNEQKSQGGKFFDHNKEHYLSKYPDDPSVQNQTDWT
jgi:hypothetical protein